MPKPLNPAERIVVALDVPNASMAMELAMCLKGKVGMLKVGLELFCAEGPSFVRRLQEITPVFLDLKFHDIPTTVRKALDAVLVLNPRLVNIHALGGAAMTRAAVEAVRAHRERGGCTELLAVTVLTSLDHVALADIGCHETPASLVMRLARLAKQCGVDGVVCSAQEAAAIKEVCSEHFHCLTPGIRPAGGPTQDQSRVMTPSGAVAMGADWLVIGRPITHAPDPAAAADEILAEISESH